jgi:chromosome segregation ATPase
MQVIDVFLFVNFKLNILCLAHNEMVNAEKEASRLERECAELQKQEESRHENEDKDSDSDSNEDSDSDSDGKCEGSVGSVGWEVPVSWELERIESELAGARGGLVGVVGADAGVVAGYERRRSEMRVLRGAIADSQGARVQRHSELVQVKDKWLPTLRTLIQTINNTFGKYFAAIGCAGEVKLKEGKAHNTNNSNNNNNNNNNSPETLDTDDFENYAIDIRVKFRAEVDLQSLDSHRQSGGVIKKNKTEKKTYSFFFS